MGVEADVQQIAAEISERDLRDSSRSEAPLKQAPDAVLIETDGLTLEQVINAVIAVHDQKVKSTIRENSE